MAQLLWLSKRTLMHTSCVAIILSNILRKKKYLISSCIFLKNPLLYKMSWSCIKCRQSPSHLTSLWVRHIGIIDSRPISFLTSPRFFFVFLNSVRKILREYLEITHHELLPRPSTFLVHNDSVWHCIIHRFDSVFKQLEREYFHQKDGVTRFLRKFSVYLPYYTVP